MILYSLLYPFIPVYASLYSFIIFLTPFDSSFQLYVPSVLIFIFQKSFIPFCTSFSHLYTFIPLWTPFYPLFIYIYPFLYLLILLDTPIYTSYIHTISFISIHYLVYTSKLFNTPHYSFIPLLTLLFLTIRSLEKHLYPKLTITVHLLTIWWI